MLTGHEHLRGAFPCHLVPGRQFACVSFIRRLQALPLGRDVPQLQILVVAAQRPRERVLGRMIEDQQRQPPGEPQATGLPLADGVPEETGRSHAGWLKRDDARNRQQVPRVVFACEPLKSAGQEQDRQDVVRGAGHRGAGPVSAPSRAPGMSSPALSGLSGERVAAEISAGLTFRGW
jgi:hypothetical protein